LKCIRHFNLGSSHIESDQVVATYVMMKLPDAYPFIWSWFQACCVPKLIDDSPTMLKTTTTTTEGKREVKEQEETEVPGFLDHRHDQSIFSCLYKTFHLRSFPLTELQHHIFG
jgi:hypothetical protein